MDNDRFVVPHIKSVICLGGPSFSYQGFHLQCDAPFNHKDFFAAFGTTRGLSDLIIYELVGGVDSKDPEVRHNIESHFISTERPMLVRESYNDQLRSLAKLPLDFEDAVVVGFIPGIDYEMSLYEKGLAVFEGSVERIENPSHSLKTLFNLKIPFPYFDRH